MLQFLVTFTCYLLPENCYFSGQTVSPGYSAMFSTTLTLVFINLIFRLLPGNNWNCVSVCMKIIDVYMKIALISIQIDCIEFPPCFCFPFISARYPVSTKFLSSAQKMLFSAESDLLTTGRYGEILELEKNTQCLMKFLVASSNSRKYQIFPLNWWQDPDLVFLILWKIRLNLSPGLSLDSLDSIPLNKSLYLFHVYE